MRDLLVKLIDGSTVPLLEASNEVFVELMSLHVGGCLVMDHPAIDGQDVAKRLEIEAIIRGKSHATN